MKIFIAVLFILMIIVILYNYIFYNEQPSNINIIVVLLIYMQGFLKHRDF